MTELALKLEELIQQPAHFKLKATGEMEHWLRIPNVDDQAWMKATFGNDLEKVLNSTDINGMAKLAFRLLKDKAPFSARDFEGYNDDGEIEKKRLVGFEVLAQSIEGFQERINVYRALLSTVGMSQPVLDKLKKKAEAMARAYSEAEASAGPTSSTSSPTNTDGPSEKSESLPSEK